MIALKDIFLLEYSRDGDLPQVKRKIVEMVNNGSGIRDTARVLKISVNTVISELKKRTLCFSNLEQNAWYCSWIVP